MKLRQLFCHHKKMITTEYLGEVHGERFIAERVEKCAKCGKTKYFYAYGHERIKDWRKQDENDS